MKKICKLMLIAAVIIAASVFSILTFAKAIILAQNYPTAKL